MSDDVFYYENLLVDCEEILFELLDKVEINNEELIMYG